MLHKVKKKKKSISKTIWFKQHQSEQKREEENGVSSEIKIKCRKIWSKYS